MWRDLAVPAPVRDLAVADFDGDGALNLTDPVFLLGHLFLGGPEPPLPGPSVCGVDPTADDLDPCDLACGAGG